MKLVGNPLATTAASGAETRSLKKYETYCLYGTFTDMTTKAGIAGEPRFSAGSAFADYDNDGWLDLVVVNYVSVDLKTAPDCSQGGIPAYCRPEDFAPGPDVLYRNNGDGTFTELGELSGVARNEHGDVESSMGIDTADYDNDGDFDVILTHYQAETKRVFG